MTMVSPRSHLRYIINTERYGVASVRGPMDAVVLGMPENNDCHVLIVNYIKALSRHTKATIQDTCMSEYVRLGLFDAEVQDIKDSFLAIEDDLATYVTTVYSTWM